MLEALQQRLGYVFCDNELLLQALRHRSYTNEHPEKVPHNERLEFLGDAVLEFIISDFLYVAFPNETEGSLSQMRARLVNTQHLVQLARSLDVGEVLFLSKGELLTLGQNKDSILAGAMEALLAAIYLDGGMEAARLFVQRHFEQAIVESQNAEREQDFKTLLQEKVQRLYQEVPTYRILSESGPDHNKLFVAEVSFRQVRQEGDGKNKKAAEQEAAKYALRALAE